MNKASRLLLVHQLKQIAPGIVVGSVMLLLVFALYLGGPLFSAYDEQGKMPQHQVGTVTNITNRLTTRGNQYPAALVSIQIGTRATTFNSHYPLHVGQQLSVDYKIGRSGIVYIDNFQPISGPR